MRRKYHRYIFIAQFLYGTIHRLRICAKSIHVMSNQYVGPVSTYLYNIQD